MKQPYTSTITLELRNAHTGELQKCVTHNFAANQTIANGAWQQRNAFKTGLGALGGVDTDYQPHWAANAVVLTDSTLPEDPANESFMYGKTVGYALKSTYAGTDIWRGTAAPTQIEATPDHVKWVFDWPTHAANGTIGSVGWIDSQQRVESATMPVFTQTMTQQKTNATPAWWTRFTQANPTQAFGNTGNTIIYVLDATTYAQTTTFNVNGQFSAIRGIAWDGTNSFLWVIGDNGSDRRIAAYNASGVLQTGPFTPTSRAYSFLAHDGSNLWSITDNGSNNYTAWKLSPTDGTDVSNFSFSTPPSNGVSGIAWDKYKNLLWVRRFVNSVTTSGIQAWDSTGKPSGVEVSMHAYVPSSANYTTNLGYSYWNGGSGDFDMVSSSQFVFCLRDGDGSSYSMSTCQLDGMGTRALLPTPVVKNNTQTLKLIYTINYT